MGNSILSGLQTKVYIHIYNNKQLGSHCISKKCAGTEAFIDQTQPFREVVMPKKSVTVRQINTELTVLRDCAGTNGCTPAVLALEE